MNLKLYEGKIYKEVSEILKSDEIGFFDVNLSSLNQGMFGIEEKKFNSKDDAYNYFDKLVKEEVSRLEDKISKYDLKNIIENLMQYLSPLVKLSFMTGNGKVEFFQDFPTLWTRFKKSENKIVQSTNLKAYLGEQKKRVDVLINMCLIGLDGEIGSLTKRKITPEEIYDTLEDVSKIIGLYSILQGISKENKKEFNTEIIYIEHSRIFYPGLKNYMLNILENTALKEYGYSDEKESQIKRINKLYEEELGFSTRTIINTFLPVFSQNHKTRESVFFKQKAELKKLINLSNETVTLRGLIVLLESNMCLEYKKQDKYNFIFSNVEKITNRGILKIKDQYIFSFSTISSYTALLQNNMLNQNFLKENGIDNKKIARYLATNYSEWWLYDIKSRMNEKGIWFKIQIKNFEKYFKFPQENKITKEVDFIFFDMYSKTLYIGEYKNWQDVSFNFKDVHQEQQKIKKIIQSHEKLISILNSDVMTLLNMLGIDKYINNIEEVNLELINVFENRNISSNYPIYGGTNQDRKVRNFSKMEFEKYLQNNAEYFLKMHSVN